MKKRIIGYRNHVDEILSDNKSRTNRQWQEILEEHLVQIGFFQHERLIHLIVTVTFAIMTVLSLFAPLLSGVCSLYAFTLMLLVLLIPYVFHYYTLENETQKMYAQYNEILKRVRETTGGF